MKKKITILMVAIILIAAVSLFAVTVKSIQTSSGGNIFDPVKITTQSVTGLAASKITIFDVRKLILSDGWTLYVVNVGANPLTDLDVIVKPTSTSTYEVMLDDDHANYSNISASNCSDTLAATVSCVVTSSGRDSFGYLQVDAKAAASTVANIDVYLIENTK